MNGAEIENVAEAFLYSSGPVGFRAGVQWAREQDDIKVLIEAAQKLLKLPDNGFARNELRAALKEYEGEK